MRKVSQFIGFYHKVWKTSVVMLLTRTKTSIYIYIDTPYGTYKVSRENTFVVYRISTKTTNVFLLSSFYRTWYIYTSYIALDIGQKLFNNSVEKFLLTTKIITWKYQ